MTTVDKIRNGIHVYLGAIIPYTALSYTIIEMGELQMFIIKMLGCALLSGFLGGAIELYQSYFLNQKYKGLGDIKITITGGLIGGVICVVNQQVTFITNYLFYSCLVIIVAEIIRSQVVLRIKK